MKKNRFLSFVLVACVFSIVACDTFPSRNENSESKVEEPEIVYHTVTFDSQGAQKSIEPQKIEDGGKVAAPADPEKTGYTFAKWTYNGKIWSFENDVVLEELACLGFYISK